MSIDPSQAQAHLERGKALDAQGDSTGAQDAYAMADAAGSAEGALWLGVKLKSHGDLEGAKSSYARGESRGDPRASCQLGMLLEDLGDIEGAKAAYLRADAVGFPDGAYSLGQLLHAQGDIDGALNAMRRADDLGDPDGAFNLGVLLKQRADVIGARDAFARAESRGHPGAAGSLGKALQDLGDRAGAEAAFRRSDTAGDPNGTYDLGALLYGSGDIAGAIDAFDRAAQRGHAGAADIASQLRSSAPPPPRPEQEVNGERWIELRGLLINAGARQLSSTVVLMEIPRGDTGRSQQVSIVYEVIEPDYEIIRFHSPFGRLDSVVATDVVKHVGQRLIGALGYTPANVENDQGDGILSIGSSIPLMMIDTKDAGSVLLFIALLAGAGDRLEEQWTGGDVY